MPSPLEELTRVLGGDTVSQLSNAIGADREATGRAVGAAMPLLFSALARNAQRPGGAAALGQALDRDHDGSVLDDLAGFLGGGSPAAGATEGDGILRHALGGRRTAAEAMVGRASGLDAQSVSRLLAMLAPLVMGALGRTRQRQELDDAGLAGMLGRERQRAEAAAPGGLGSLAGLLDSDGDGEVLDDALRIGGDLLSGFLKKR